MQSEVGVVLLQWLWEWQYSVQRKAIPPVVARIFYGRQHLTFDKGGKCVGDFRGIVRFWKGWRGARDGGEAIPPS